MQDDEYFTGARQAARMRGYLAWQRRGPRNAFASLTSVLCEPCTTATQGTQYGCSNNGRRDRSSFIRGSDACVGFDLIDADARLGPSSIAPAYAYAGSLKRDTV